MAFLLKFVLGGRNRNGAVLRFISYLFTTRADVPLRFFFPGSGWQEVFPMICREAGVKTGPGAVAYPAMGILGVVLLALIPSGLLHRTEVSGPRPLLLQLAGDSSLRWAGPARDQRVSDALYAGNL